MSVAAIVYHVWSNNLNRDTNILTRVARDLNQHKTLEMSGEFIRDTYRDTRQL